MRLPIRIFTSAIGALSVVSAVAQETRPYEPTYRAWLELGGACMESTEMRGFPGTSGASKVRFHPGVRVGMGAEWSFTPYFALDWEAAVIGSSVDDASGLTEMDAFVTQVPLLMNATLQYANSTGFTPFVGIGVGGSSTAINIDEARSGSTSVDGSDYDFVFAWQATGGVKYELRNGLTLGIVYKYLWTSDAEWEVENDSGIGTTDNELELEGIRSHSILAFVSYRF